MKGKYFFIEPILAGAAIHITNITPVMDEGCPTHYLVHYEFQYKSRGNYTWCKCARMLRAPEKDFEQTLASALLYYVRVSRRLLEDPADRGKYNYIDPEETTIDLGETEGDER